MRASQKLILQTLEELYKKLRRPVRPVEIYNYLKLKGIEVSDRRVRETLSNLAKKNVVKKIVIGNKVFYEPLELSRAKRSSMAKSPEAARNVGPSASMTTLDTLIKPPTTSEEVSAAVERQEDYQLTRKVAHQIIVRLSQVEVLTKIVKRHADRLAEKDPVDLAVGLLRTACMKFYEYARLKEGEKYRLLVDSLESVIRRWYIPVLGVPASDLSPSQARKLRELWLEGKVDENVICGHAEKVPDVLVSPVTAISYFFEEEAGGEGISFIAFSEERLKRILRLRFTDDRLVVPTVIPKAKEVAYVTGHDTSYWPIVFDPLFLMNRPGPTVEVYVLAGIIFSTWRSARGPEAAYMAEVIPDPKRLSELYEDTAKQKGFIITPEMLEESEAGRKRIIEASMNILEYTLISEELNPVTREKGLIIYGDSTSPRPMFTPRPVFHDGRLFPYEHKIDDYAVGYGKHHSELVRISYLRFRDIIRMVVGDPSVIVIGVVKRPYSPALHPLIVYGLYKEGAIDDEGLWRFLPRWSYTERYEVEALLKGVYEKKPLGDDKTYRTVGILRRFWAMDIDIVEAFMDPDYGAEDQADEVDEEFWLEKVVIDYKQVDKKRADCGRGVRGYLCLKRVKDPYAAETLSYILAKATVAMAYVLPPRQAINLDVLLDDRRPEKLALPRYEVLVPPPPKEAFINSGSGALEDYMERVRGALSWIALPKISDEKGTLTDYAAPEIVDEAAGRPFRFLTIVPYHIFMADRFVKEYDDQLRNLYKEDLFREIGKILRRRGLISENKEG